MSFEPRFGSYKFIPISIDSFIENQKIDNPKIDAVQLKSIRPSKPIFCPMILASIFTGKKQHGTQKSSFPGNV